MNKPKEGKGAITSLACGINSIDLDDTKNGIEEANRIGKEVDNALRRKALEERSEKMEEEKEQSINPNDLVEKAKEYIENDGMYRE